MNIEVELVTDEKNFCAANVECKDVEKSQRAENEYKEQEQCKISKMVEEGSKMSENTAGINKRRHSESEDENISTVKKTKHNEKMEVGELNVLEKNKLESISVMVQKPDTFDVNVKDINIDSSNESRNACNVASSNDDQDDLLDRLDAIDSSGLRPPDLKLDEIDTTDLEKDDLLKRLEEAEGGIESEPLTIQNLVDDQIMINEDLLLDGEIILNEKEELEQPSSTNTDSIVTEEKVNDEISNVLTLEHKEFNEGNTADSAVFKELDNASYLTETKEKALEIHVSENSKSEIIMVDSTDEQISIKSTESSNENIYTVDSTNEKLINLVSEVPSTSSNIKSYSKIMIEAEINPKVEPNFIEIVNCEKPIEVETCVDSTNKEEKTTDTATDKSVVEKSTIHGNESAAVDSSYNAKSEKCPVTIEIAVDSTNDETKSKDIDMIKINSNIKPVLTENVINAKMEIIQCDESECKEAIISSGNSIAGIENIAEKSVTLKDDTVNTSNIENSEVILENNSPLPSEKLKSTPKDNIIDDEDVINANLEESSEAQPAVQNVPSELLTLEKESKILMQEIILHTADSIKSEELTPTTSVNIIKTSSEAQPLQPENTVEIENPNEILNTSVTSSSKEDLSSDPSFQRNSITLDNTYVKDRPLIEITPVEISASKPNESSLKDIQTETMDVDENLLADNEAVDLCEQPTAVVIDCSNDEEITSNVNEYDTNIKSNTVKIEDATRYSDSTASINSTSEEALINYNKETHIEENDKCDGNLNMSVDETINPKILNKDKLFGNVMLMNNGSSTPNSNNTSVTTSNVFNSTPIQTNFEISSENVSKMSENPKPCSSTSVIILNDDTTIADTTDEEVTESDTQCSSDGITNFAKSIIKLNGLSPSSSQSDDIKSIDEDNLPKDTLNGLNLDLTNETSEEALYEVGIWYEENEMKYFSIEKLDRTKKFVTRLTPASSSDVTGNESSDKRSSNGSIGSLGPFTLPQSRLSALSSNSSSSMSQKSIGKFAIPALPQRNKQTIKGISTLCNFMIEHFSKIKSNLNQSHDNLEDSLPYTPKGRGKDSKKSLIKEHDEFSYEEKSQSSKGNKRKADTSNDSISTGDDEKTPKLKLSKKLAKTSNLNTSKQGHFLVPPSEVLDDTKIGLNVLARWIDKKYYAGKVVESKPGMKYVIKFEDGAHKTLPQDLIVFGRDENILPLLGHQVHASVENDEYEVGYVQESEIENGIIYYKISIDTKIIRVTSSDIYLTDDQAKSIQDVFKNTIDFNVSDDKLNLTDGSNSKMGLAIKVRPHRNVVQKPEVIAATTATGRGSRGKKGDKTINETEAGFSGGITPNKRGRKPKRPQPQSESSDVSDSLELDSAPNSPDSALEAINGVQPELQKTPKESQINKMCIMAEYLGTDKPDKNKNLEDLLGPIPNNKSLFRNKHFILTCTIAMKSPRPSSTKKSETPDDMKNKYRKFTSLPFIKEHLRKQIEEGGGKVYNHFEDIPKNKYKQCKLISPSPCVTAKYVQCLAAEIPAISHEWIIESCRNNSLVDTKLYALPSGWSLIEERYIKWAVGRNIDQRSTSNPLSNQIVLMASQNKDFSDFWTRVCKLAGSTIRVVKTAADITQGQTGYMLTDEEFPQDIKSKAEHFGIPIVSTVWVVQSLILGKVCRPDADEKLTQIYQDDDY